MKIRYSILFTLFLLSCKKDEELHCYNGPCITVVDRQTLQPLSGVDMEFREVRSGFVNNQTNFTTGQNGMMCENYFSFNEVVISKNGYISETIHEPFPCKIHLSQEAFIQVHVSNIFPATMNDFISINFRPELPGNNNEYFYGVVDATFIRKVNPSTGYITWSDGVNAGTIHYDVMGGQTTYVNVEY